MKRTARRYLLLSGLLLVSCLQLEMLPGRWNASAVYASANAAYKPKIEKLDAALDRLLAEDAKAVEVASGFKWTEGPVWLPSGRLLFADIPSNSIRMWMPGAGVRIFMQPSGYRGVTPFCGPEPGSNGMTLDSKGRLTVAGHAQRNVWRLDRLDPAAKPTILADTYQGKRLNSPNDLVYRSDGSLYFTDPPYGLCTQSDHDPAKELQVNGVYRIRGASQQSPGAPPSHANLQLLVRDMPRPNGLAFSPDEKYLYISNSEPAMFWMRYTVRRDGSLAEPKRLFDAGPYAHHGAPDGMKVDQNGNLYSAGPGGVWILSPEGKHLGTIHLPDPVGNLTFGGPDRRTLYVAASSKIYSIRVKIPGVLTRSE